MKTEQSGTTASDYELFRLLRDVHPDDASCWKAVREAQTIYRRFKRSRYAMQENESDSDGEFYDS